MTTSAKKDDNPSKRGRPRHEIDLELVEKLGTIHCTDVEIASICGVSLETFTRRKREEDFGQMLDEARARGKASLRRIQWQLAQNGNAAMAIFLGKNLLGQRDRFDDQLVDVTPLPWSD